MSRLLSKKFLFSLIALFVLTAMVLTGRATWQDVEVILGALITGYLGIQSAIDWRRKTKITPGELQPPEK